MRFILENQYGASLFRINTHDINENLWLFHSIWYQFHDKQNGLTMFCSATVLCQCVWQCVWQASTRTVMISRVPVSRRFGISWTVSASNAGLGHEVSVFKPYCLRTPQTSPFRFAGVVAPYRGNCALSVFQRSSRRRVARCVCRNDDIS